MTVMRVWQAYHPDGSLRKTWAACIEGGTLITRWGPADRRLGKPVSVDLKGATPSARLAQLEREKEQGASRYRFLGKKDVTDDGEILDCIPAEPKQEQQKPGGYFTMTANLVPALIEDLRKAGYFISGEGDLIQVGRGASGVQIALHQKGGRITAGIKAKEATAEKLLAVMYLAKRGGGRVTDPGGEFCDPAFDVLVDRFGDEARGLRETAELLGLAPKVFAKSLKSRSGLFNFGGQHAS